MSNPNASFKIPIFRPLLPTANTIKVYLEGIDENRWYSNYGPLSREFEARLARYFGIAPKNLVTLANATLALEGAIETCGNSSEWICPSWTFAATPSAILRAGRSLKFADVGTDWKIELNAEKLNGNVLEVAPFGDKPSFQKFQNVEGAVLFDAAASFDSLHNFGAQENLREFGMVVSLHATKSLPAGEGGVFISNNPDWVEKVRQWGNFGFDQDRNATFLGTNAKLSEYSAAVGLSSLDQWEIVSEKWRVQMQWMKALCSDLELTLTPAANQNYVSPYFIIEAQPEKVVELEAICDQMGIQTRKWWGSGCHQMPAFRSYKHDDLSHTELLARKSIALPFFLDLSSEEKEYVEKAIKNVF